MPLHRLTPIFLVAALAVSWLAKSNNGFKLSLLAFVLYLAWRLCSAATRMIAVRARRRERARMPVFSLQGTTLRMRSHNGTEQEKPLEHVSQVLIMTTDQGPFVCDSFLLLLFQGGEEWRIALEYPCYQNFYDALSESLPLDAEQTLLAAFSTTNAVFRLWERKEDS